jgi:PAS domain S-box-containing protein
MPEHKNPETYVSNSLDQQFGLAVGVGYQSLQEPLPHESQAKGAFRPGEVRRLLEHSPGFIAVVRGDNLTFELVNAAFAELVGSRDLVGKPARDALPELGSSFFDALQQVYTTGRPTIGRGAPLVIQRESGAIERRYIDFVYQPITGDEGTTAGVFLQGHDVTDQKRTEEWLRLALQGGRIAAWERDLTTDYVTWSENALDLLGISSGLASTFARCIHPEDREKHQEALRCALKEGSQYDVVLRYIKPDGSTIWISHRADVQQGPEGFNKLSGITVDITKQVLAEHELRRREERYRTDLEAAATVQRSLLPQDGAAGSIRYRSFLQPSSFIGGDTFNVIEHDRTLSFFLVDVCGHGAAAALISVAAHHSLTDTTNRNPSLPPEEIVRQVCRSWPNDLPYFTMIYGRVDLDTGAGSLIQAGHPHPLLIHPDGDVVALGEGGLPIGIDADSVHEPVSFMLTPGDGLLLYSDGVTEAENPLGEHFSEERLINLLVQYANQTSDVLVRKLTDHVRQWSSGASVSDDISVLWIERT